MLTFKDNECEDNMPASVLEFINCIRKIQSKTRISNSINSSRNVKWLKYLIPLLTSKRITNLVFIPICLCRELNRWKVICQREFLQPTVNRQWVGRQWTCRAGFFSFEKLILGFCFYLRYHLHICRKLLELARICIFWGYQL